MQILYITLVTSKGRRWFSEMRACAQRDVGQVRETLWYASGLYRGNTFALVTLEICLSHEKS